MAAFAIVVHGMDYCFSNAEYLQDRLNRTVDAQSSDASDADFFAWKDVFAAAGETVFSKRLASLNLDEVQALRMARRAKDNGEQTAPEWLLLLQEAFDSSNAISTDADQPFAKIWAPIAAHASTKIEFGTLVSQNAASKFVGFLHSEICHLAAESTYSIFCDFRTRGFTFDSFTEIQRRSNCADIFSKYPVLARLIGTLALRWIETTKAFLERLERDRALLSSVFTIPPEIHLTSVELGLSDRHAGGFQAILAEFGPTKILYKPKDMSLEALLPSINQCLGAAGFPVTFQISARHRSRGLWVGGMDCSKTLPFD